MANLIQLSEQLKAVPDEFLAQQIQNPTGVVPPYLVLGELNRRKALRSSMAQPPTSTVAEDVLGAQPMQQAPAQAPPMQGIDVLNQRQPQPQLPMPPQPGIPSPVPAGLASMAPPAPQFPPAPQRMAKGGVVRMYSGTLVPYLGGVVPYPGVKTQEEIRREQAAQQMELDRLEGGGTQLRIPRPNGVMAEYNFGPYPKLKLPQWTDQPITVREPDFNTVLQQVRAATAAPEGPTPLDHRIEELERARLDLRRPRRSDWLIDTGLGMMASQAQYPMQALGAAGLGATQGYRARQDRADVQELALTERLAQIEAAREEQRNRLRQSDLSIAGDLTSRLAGSAMVNAQAEAQDRAARRAYNLDVSKAEHDAELAGYKTETALQELLAKHDIERMPKPLPAEYSPEAIDARIRLARGEAQARHDYPYGYTGLGYGPDSDRPMNNADAESQAATLFANELRKGTWGIGAISGDPKYVDSSFRLFKDMKADLMDKVASGRLLPELSQTKRDQVLGRLSQAALLPKSGLKQAFDDYFAQAKKAKEAQIETDKTKGFGAAGVPPAKPMPASPAAPPIRDYGGPMPGAKPMPAAKPLPAAPAARPVSSLYPSADQFYDWEDYVNQNVSRRPYFGLAV